jgi:uncharacterized protein (TIGR03067 family)
MKHTFLISLIVLSFLLANCGRKGLVGKFKNVDPTKSDIEFTSDGHFSLLSEDKPFMKGTYKTDDSKSPKHIDLILDASNINPNARNDAKGSPAVGIYKFEGNKLTIKFANGTDASVIYPSDFSDEPTFQIMQLTF